MCIVLFFLFFNDTATTEIYTLSLHDALPILFGTRHDQHAHARMHVAAAQHVGGLAQVGQARVGATADEHHRSEEHTSELQSQSNLVCRLLLEKKKIKKIQIPHNE